MQNRKVTHKRGAWVRASEEQRVVDLFTDGKEVSAIYSETGISLSKVYEIIRELVPRLRLGAPSVMSWTDGRITRQFATVEVQATSKVEAEECWGRVEVSHKGILAPLHWAVTPR